jgi:hypothetical protein
VKGAKELNTIIKTARHEWQKKEQIIGFYNRIKTRKPRVTQNKQVKKKNGPLLNTQVIHMDYTELLNNM